MDNGTIEAYDRDPEAFAREWHEQPPGADLQAVVREFFSTGPTADIGCGSGRDADWLTANGYPATGYEASAGLLTEARRRYPDLEFHRGALPDLDGVEAGSYANVLCETVIMHLQPAALIPSLGRLTEILGPAGTLYLSWRVTRDQDRRDEHGRLYAVVDPAVVRRALSGTELLLDEERSSASSGQAIHRIVARTSASR